MFAAFTEECLAAPFTDQVFHFVVPVLADAQTAFPFEPFLDALLSVDSRGSRARGGAPWLFYFVLTVGENYLGMNSRRSHLSSRSAAWRVGQEKAVQGGGDFLEGCTGRRTVLNGAPGRVLAQPLLEGPQVHGNARVAWENGVCAGCLPVRARLVAFHLDLRHFLEYVSVRTSAHEHSFSGSAGQQPLPEWEKVISVSFEWPSIRHDRGCSQRDAV